MVYRKSARSLKSVQEPNFFSLFPRIFLAILTRPNRPKAVWLASEWRQQAPVIFSDFLDKRAQSYACFFVRSVAAHEKPHVFRRPLSSRKKLGLLRGPADEKV